MNNASLIHPPRKTNQQPFAESFLNLGSFTRFLAVSTTLLLTLWSSTAPCAASETDAAPLQASTPEAGFPESSGSPQPQPTPRATSATAAEVVLHDPEEDTVADAPPPPPSGSGGIAVFPVEATNLTGGQSAALGALLTSELRAAKGGRLIPPKQAGEHSSHSSDRKSAAAYMKVEQYLLVEAVRLDRITIVTATLYDENARVASSAKMSAASVDDFQPVSERLVTALLEGKSAEKTRTLDNVTAQEAEASNRTFVEKVFGFKTGFIVPYSAQMDLPTMAATSFDARLEGDNYFLEIGAGLLIPSSTTSRDNGGYGGVVTELGANYYLNQQNISPYIGAGVMPRIVSRQPANLAGFAQAGLMLFRTSSSRLYTELRVAQNFTPMEIHQYTYDDSTDVENYATTRYRPIEFGFNVGLGW